MKKAHFIIAAAIMLFLHLGCLQACFGAVAFETAPMFHGWPYTDYPLSTDPSQPTTMVWLNNQLVTWSFTTDGSCPDPPSGQWCIQDGDNATQCHDVFLSETTMSCLPAEELEQGTYRFWAAMTDCSETVRSDDFYLYIQKTSEIETTYHPTEEVFLGRLAHLERTSFISSAGMHPNAIADAPSVTGCDNPSMFYADGKMHIIFGDPKVSYMNGNDPEHWWPDGVMAVTDRIVPEKGLDLSHNRNWITDEAGRATSIISRSGSHLNNTGGAIIQTDSGKTLWFGTYDRCGGYRTYRHVALAYTFDTDLSVLPELRQELTLWSAGEFDQNCEVINPDPLNGSKTPDPYLGYSMRIYKDHFYIMMPRLLSEPVLLRASLSDLKSCAETDTCSLAQWYYLVSAADNGTALWSQSPIQKGQISHEDMPTVAFGAITPVIVNSVIWNPYANRWLALSKDCRIWTAKYFWGPYAPLNMFGVFPFKMFEYSYNCFTHELMLGNNGEYVYYGRARPPNSVLYGTYQQRLHLSAKLALSLSQKCAETGNTVTITCLNQSGLTPESPDNMTVTVDGNAATFSHQDANAYVFSYTLTGSENGGQAGEVEVAACLKVPGVESADYLITRDVALVVNHINNLSCTITSHSNSDPVTGRIRIHAEASYDIGPEDLGLGRPDVQIIKTELRFLSGSSEVVEDVDVEPPYELQIDTSRYANGPQTFKVVVYDTLDRRGTASIVLNVNNPAQAIVPGNLVLDGNMESAGISAWQSFNGGALSKVADGTQRNAQKSLHLRSETPDSWSGMEQTITGLSGGEQLRLTGWSRVLSNLTGRLRWTILDRSAALISQECTSYGYFRRFQHAFTNAAGNDAITIRCEIFDNGTESTVAGADIDSVEAIIDDLVLQPDAIPMVAQPQNLLAQVDCTAGSVALTWDAGIDVNVEYYYIYRRHSTQPGDAFVRIAEVSVWNTSYVDTATGGSPGEYVYRVEAVDTMATRSSPAEVYADPAPEMFSGVVRSSDKHRLSTDPARATVITPGTNAVSWALWDDTQCCTAPVHVEWGYQPADNASAWTWETTGITGCFEPWRTCWSSADPFGSGLASDTYAFQVRLTDCAGNTAESLVYYITDDPDGDDDGIQDEADNCPDVCNPLQQDADLDGIGDLCDWEPGCTFGGCVPCEEPCPEI